MSARRPNRSPWIPTLLALLGCCFPPARAGRDEEAGAPLPSPREEMRAALDTLLRADSASRLEAAEEAGKSLRLLERLDCNDVDSRGFFEALERIVRTEKDDWIASRLLENLLPLDTDCLNPLYRQALKSRSPNLRWRGVQWFADEEDEEAVPLLEDLWRSEKRPWVQVDLMGALAENGDAAYLEEFLKVAAGESPPLSRAAFEAIKTLGDPAAIPGLARLSREGEERVRLEAVSVLASWPDSPEALAAVLDATGAEDAGLQERGASGLGSFADRRAADRALALARAGHSVEIRSAALRALKELDPPETVPLLTDILHEPPTEENAALQDQAIGMLQELDDPSALPLLSDLDPELGGAGFHDLAWLLRSLSRTGSPESPREVRVRISCGGFLVAEDAGDPGPLIVAPPAGQQSIRCWRFPGVAGDPEDFERIPGGTAARVVDHFEREDGPWVEIRAEEITEDCWLPRLFLRPPDPARSPAAPPTAPEPLEFDLPFSDLRAGPARSLEMAGILRVFDPADDVAGISLAVEPGNETALELLIRSCGPVEGILKSRIEELLERIGLSCPRRGTEDPADGDGTPPDPVVDD